MATVNELRKDLGMALIDGPDGDLTPAQLKAKYAAPIPQVGYSQEQIEHAAEALGVEPHVAKAWLRLAPSLRERDLLSPERRLEAATLKETHTLSLFETEKLLNLESVKTEREADGKQLLTADAITYAALTGRSALDVESLTKLYAAHAESGLTEDENKILDAFAKADHPALTMTPQDYVAHLGTLK